MVVELVEILVGEGFAIHLLDAVGEQTAVQTDEAGLGELADERGDVLVLHVGVGVVLRTRGGILCLHVVGEELHLLQRLAVLGVLLAVEHEALRHLVVALAHQCFLNLVLDVLHADALLNVEVAEDLRHYAEVHLFVN